MPAIPERDYDIVVIGGGGAGMSAAITAAKTGASVLVVEAADRPGGSLALSGGVFYAAGTRIQRARGIASDDVEAMYRYFMAINQWRAEPSLGRLLCESAEPTLEWLISLGVKFPEERLYSSCADGVLRGHQAEEYGFEIARQLEAAMGGLPNVQLVCKTRVRSLLERDGAVAGIRVDGQDVQAGAVVIATGGFGHDKAMLQQYYPSAAAHGDWTFSILAPHCKGDGIVLARQAGAAIQGFDRGLLCSTTNFSKQLEFSRPPWLVSVNREGRKFVDKSQTYIAFAAIQAQTSASCHAIFDEAARLAMTPDAGDAFSAHIRSHNWTPDRVLELVKEGKILRRDTLGDLAEACGMFHPKALANTIARYNRDVDEGHDSLFFKPASAMRAVRTPPYYAAEMRSSVVALTFAGLRIDTRAQVASEEEAPIPGLFAAGDVAGNVMGQQYAGGGISIANAIVFGRIAGAEAAQFAGPHRS